MRDNIRLIAGLVLTGLVILFTLQNAQAVQVRLLFWRFGLSLALLVFGILTVGFLAGWLVAGWLHWRRRRERAQDA